MTRIALVTGANRGIGLELVRQLASRGSTVVLGCRDLAAGESAAAGLGDLPGDVLPRHLDVQDRASLQTVADELMTSHGHLDLLINSAGVMPDQGLWAKDVDLDVVRSVFETNVFGAWSTAQVFLPLLQAADHARIVNVGSGLGSLDGMGGGIPAYRMSKTMLNSLTRLLASELEPDGIAVNTACPGFVATDMTGNRGRPVSEGAASVLMVADLPNPGATGGNYRDGETVPW